MSVRRPYSTRGNAPMNGPLRESMPYQNSRNIRKSETASDVKATRSHEFPSDSLDDEGHSHAAETIEALQSSSDRGSRITLVGLYANIALTGAKGVAGWYMHSASLLADAGHSLSDLLGDFVTLFCWKLSRRPPSSRYPYGFGKFETLGTTTVSLFLMGGALGIGFHSFNLLVDALSQTASTLAPGAMRDVLMNITSVAPSVPSLGHGHASPSQLDPNAAWFAAVSIVSKEWLYRITKKVADEERSPVLFANAIHHRSDAYSSLVALFAILGSSLFPAIPLDPIGGLLVSAVILRQGLRLFGDAFRDLTDASVSAKTYRSIMRALEPLVSPPSSTRDITAQRIIGIRHLRAKRAGSLVSVDLIADVHGSLKVRDASQLDDQITMTLRKARREISEVRVRFHPIDGRESSEQ